MLEELLSDAEKRAAAAGQLEIDLQATHDEVAKLKIEKETAKDGMKKLREEVEKWKSDFDHLQATSAKEKEEALMRQWRKTSVALTVRRSKSEPCT